jgi:2-keto-3-deoxy-L-rhamnonate aldolase RhmA
MEGIIRNKLKEKLDSGKIAFGVQLRSNSARVAEIAGLSGFDFLYIDTEHWLISDETLEHLFRAAEWGGCTPVIRLYDCSPARVTQIVEAGARGVIFPHLETADQAKAFVEAVKYPPYGHRSSPEGRFSDYGFAKMDDMRKTCNENTLAIGMIESRKGAENLDAILETGIDTLRIGFNDLSQDMGFIGQPRHPEVIEMTRRIVSVAKEHGVAVGGKAHSLEDAKFFADLGFRHFTLLSDLDLLCADFRSLVETYKAV